jgi:hypothetical protein
MVATVAFYLEMSLFESLFWFSFGILVMIAMINYSYCFFVTFYYVLS